MQGQVSVGLGILQDSVTIRKSRVFEEPLRSLVVQFRHGSL